jgi:hypothetical protein
MEKLDLKQISLFDSTLTLHDADPKKLSSSQLTSETTTSNDRSAVLQLELEALRVLIFELSFKSFFFFFHVITHFLYIIATIHM